MQLAEKWRREEETERLKDLLSRREGALLSPQSISEIGGEIAFRLSLSPSSKTDVRRLLLPYTGQRLQEGVIRLLSRKISALSPQIARGESPGTALTSPEEVEALCTRGVCGPEPRMEMRIRDGTLAGETIVRSLTPNFLQWIGMKIGLKGRHYRTFHPRELFGMQLIATLQRDERLEIDIAEIKIDDSLKRKNVQLRRDRQRAGCDVPCFYCPIGIEECDRSTHQERWEKKQCGAGHESWHDRDGCLLCQQEEYCRYAGITPDSFLPH